MKKIIELKNITKSFDGETVLDDISLDIYDNEFLTLLGPSGCGKTTTLRLIGGFETPDKGDIIFMGENINDVPPYKRNVNTVFQRYALFPHLNVFENIAFPLREKKVDRDEIEEKVGEMLSLVALKGFEHRSVTSLSGGQQQRVAIARALVSRPKVLLLDEPLAALDLKLRKDMQQELKKIQKATGITFVFVTHDQEEALSMSDTVVVMSEGRIQQIGTPIDIYNEPTNAFVADFIGESNIVDGIMLEDRKVQLERQRDDYYAALGKRVDCVPLDYMKNVAQIKKYMTDGEADTCEEAVGMFEQNLLMQQMTDIMKASEVKEEPKQSDKERFGDPLELIKQNKRKRRKEKKAKK